MERCNVELADFHPTDFKLVDSLVSEQLNMTGGGFDTEAVVNLWNNSILDWWNMNYLDFKPSELVDWGLVRFRSNRSGCEVTQCWISLISWKEHC